VSHKAGAKPGIPRFEALIGSLHRVIRRAGLDHLATLLTLERAASTAGLGHIFGPDLPFPDDDVLARWRLVLEEAGVTVALDVERGEPIGYVAYGDGWLRHFGYLPSWWGTGRAQALHDHAVGAMRSDDSARPLRLWVLVENQRARAFYARLGWMDTGVRDQEVFPPYPDKMELLLPAPSTKHRPI
jgi:RimJ/RimL family protein N-acetyltransferase